MFHLSPSEKCSYSRACPKDDSSEINDVCDILEYLKKRLEENMIPNFTPFRI